MNDRDAAFETLLRAAANELELCAPHPSIEELEALQAGALKEARREALVDHLSTCPDCIALIRDLQAFGPESGLGPDPVPGEVERATAAALAEIRRQALAQQPAYRRGSRQLFPRWSAARGPYALAASALAALLSLVIWLAPMAGRERVADLAARLEALQLEATRLRSRAEEAEQQREATQHRLGELQRSTTALSEERRRLLSPQPNTPILDLRPRRERDVGAGDGVELRLPRRAGWVSLVLSLPADTIDPPYRFEVRDAGGEVTASAGGLEPNAFGSLTVTVHQTLLPEGRLEIWIYGDSGAGSPLARYPLDVCRECRATTPRNLP
jgi:hypothetical protein